LDAAAADAAEGVVVRVYSARTMSAIRNRGDEGVLASIVGKWDSDRLNHAESLIEELETHPGWEIVQSLAAQARTNAEINLIHGPDRDHPALSRALGMLAGLDAVREIPRLVRETAARKREHIEKAEEHRSKERAHAARG
jgi:hypothetical protein